MHYHGLDDTVVSTAYENAPKIEFKADHVVAIEHEPNEDPSSSPGSLQHTNMTSCSLHSTSASVERPAEVPSKDDVSDATGGAKGVPTPFLFPHPLHNEERQLVELRDTLHKAASLCEQVRNQLNGWYRKEEAARAIVGRDRDGFKDGQAAVFRDFAGLVFLYLGWSIGWRGVLGAVILFLFIDIVRSEDGRRVREKLRAARRALFQ